MNFGKTVRIVWQMLIGFVFILLGILIINNLNMMWYVIYYMSIMVLIALILFYIDRVIRKKRYLDALKALGVYLLLVALMSNRVLYIGMLAGMFGVWALFNAAIHFLEIYLKIVHHEHGIFFKFALGVFDLVMGLLLIVSGFNNRLIVNWQVGIYIIVYGFVQIISSAKVLMGDKLSIRLSTPVFLAAFLPPILVRNVHEMKKKFPEHFNEPVEKTLGTHISVYIHVKDYGYNRLGHIDLGYNGVIYSYGAHDPKNRAFSSLFGDGVLIVGSELEFVNFSVEHLTTVYQYIIKLTAEECLKIEERIQGLYDNTTHFEVPVGVSSHLKDLKKYSKTFSFYKFYKEPFKTYNLFTTNCVMLSDYILESSGLKLMQLSGVITPGTYYNYLNNMLGKEGSVVIERRIHTY